MKIVVVCMGNTCRSPMAMAMLRQAHPSWDIQSFGLMVDHEDTGANKLAVELFPELKSHKPRQLLQSDLADIDLIITVKPILAQWILDSTGPMKAPILILDVPDPNGGKLADYQRAVTNTRRFLTKAHLLPKES